MPFHWGQLRRAACFGTVMLLLVAATGCGGKGKVSGTVTGPDGKPLPLGRIIFAPASGPGVTADIEDGKYLAEKVPAGDAKVFVETDYIKDEADRAMKLAGASRAPQPPSGVKDMDPKVAAQLEEMNRSQAEGLARAKDQLAKYRQIPDKYTKPDASGLSLTVKGGDNTFNVDLK